MSTITDALDLDRLMMRPGEGRSIDLHVNAGTFEFGGSDYATEPAPLPVHIDVSRTTGGGYALRLRTRVRLTGPCMRCLEPAAPELHADAREVSQPGGGEELSSPYFEDGVLDVRAWARDALALSAPVQVLCRPECAGLCPKCGVDLNTAGLEHGHETEPDPRWAKLREVRLK